LVIIAADIEVPLERFNIKRLYKTSTGLALKKTELEIEKAFKEASNFQVAMNSNENSNASDEKIGDYKHLMTG
ncbi:PTS fructose transporter subunit EIIBC, partial [Psychromonas aquatilis]